MSSNVQSVVCCLGYPVAGNPTQFLMQRAAAAENLDWMFVTAEVPEERLVEAFNGIRALRFSGVAFLKPHHQAATKLVDSLTESSLRSGHVRVARRDGDAWLGDDTLGVAIVDVLRPYLQGLESQASTKPSENVPARLLTLVAGESWLTHLIRIAAPEWNDTLYLLRLSDASADVANENPAPGGSENPIADVASQANESVTNEPNADFAAIQSISLESVTNSPDKIASLVIGEEVEPFTAKQIASLPFADGASIVFLHPNAIWEKALQAHPQASQLRFLKSIDIAAAKAVANFQFWTGYSIDSTDIRESLDEYCQW